MKFRYIKYGETFRPVVPVRVKLKDLNFQYEVLIDSGADFCLFHTEVAEYLEINLDKCKKGIVTGVGGKLSEYFLHPVSIEVGGWNYEMEVGFLPTIGGRSAPYGIVGQKGFFENFIVKFDLLKEEIELKTRN